MRPMRTSSESTANSIQTTPSSCDSFMPCHARSTMGLALKTTPMYAFSYTVSRNCTNSFQEKQSLQIVLTHLGQIAWRHTSSDIFTETLLQLRRSVLPCAMCCNVVLDHFAMHEGILLNLLVRCPHAKVRSQIRNFFIECLKTLREKEPTLYGLEGTDNDLDSESLVLTEGTLIDVASRLRQVADDTCQSTRGWDDFYLTLTQVIDLGHAETTAVLNHGFLEFCLNLLSMHVHTGLQDDYPELWRILSKKAGIYNRLVEFFSTLLSRMDTRLSPIATGLGKNRGPTLDRECLKFPLTHRERQMLFHWDVELKAIAVLDNALEMFDQTKLDYFCPGDIVKSMLGLEDPQAQSNLFKTINDGISLDPPFCDAYIRAALSFCEASPVMENVTKVINTVCKAIASTSRFEEERAPGGMAVLDFFIGLLKAVNEVLFEQRHRYIFYYLLLAKARVWAPALLLNHLESVRQGAHILVSELYSSHEDWPSDVLLVKWRTLRDLLGDMIQRIIYEKDEGILRMHLTPLIASCQFLVQQILDLSQDEDPDMDLYRDDANDSARVYSWRTEVEPRLQSWPQDDSLSAADLYEQSDFGSESDIDEVADVE